MAFARSMTKTQNLPQQEELLLDYARRLKRHTKGRRAVCVRLSMLTKVFRQKHHLNTAAAAFKPLLSKHDGQLFPLSNGDLVCALKDASIAEMDEVILKIRYMFRDDENIKAMERQEGEDALCEWVDIGQDYKGFVDLAKDCLENMGSMQQQSPAPSVSTPQQPEANPAKSDWIPKSEPSFSEQYRKIEAPRRPGAGSRSITPADLEKIETALQTMDVGNLILRRDVRLFAGNMTPQSIFCERYIPLESVEKALLPQCDLDADPWLYQHLRRALDRKVLTALPEMKNQASLASSIRAPVEAIFSSEFSEFDRKTGESAGNPIILEFSMMDVLKDVPAFLAARNHVREKGYRVCISDISAFVFMALLREKLAADFEKITYSAKDAGQLTGGRLEEFRETVRQAGKARVILSHCHDAGGLAFGKSAGISLFQGAHIDTL